MYRKGIPIFKRTPVKEWPLPGYQREVTILENEKLIEKLDTACGMLMVPAMHDGIVKQAMNLVSSVSFDLGLHDAEAGAADQQCQTEMIEILSVINDLAAEFIQSRGLQYQFQKYVEQWSPREEALQVESEQNDLI